MSKFFYFSFEIPQILFVQILIGKEYLHLYVIKDNNKSCYDKELEILTLCIRGKYFTVSINLLGWVRNYAKLLL